MAQAGGIGQGPRQVHLPILRTPHGRRRLRSRGANIERRQDGIGKPV